MSEYIEREKAIDYLMEIIDRPNHPEWLWTDEICGSLNAIPAADVRPVVLCRDCKYSYDSVGGWCCSHGICVDCIVREDFFCADGEKREES